MAESLDDEGYPVPACACHPDREPFAACMHCGITVCKACAIMSGEGYVCPACDEALSGRDAEHLSAEAASLAGLARRARLCGLVGLIPVLGAPVAAAAIVLSAVVLRRRAALRKPRGGEVLSLILGAAGLALTAVAVVLYVTNR